MHMNIYVLYLIHHICVHVCCVCMYLYSKTIKTCFEMIHTKLRMVVTSKYGRKEKGSEILAEWI